MDDKMLHENTTDDCYDVKQLLETLSKEVAEDVAAYHISIVAKGAEFAYGNSYYNNIAEKAGAFFAEVNWDEMERSAADTGHFLNFISTGKRFLHSFMEWARTRGAVDASTTRAIEDEIFDFLIQQEDEEDE